MNNSLSFPSAIEQQTDKPKKSLAYFLGLGLGKVVVSTRNKLSGISQAIHHSIEDDLARKLAEQAEFHDMQSQQQELAYCEEIARLKRHYLKIAILMTLVGLLMGGVSAAVLLWYF